MVDFEKIAEQSYWDTMEKIASRASVVNDTRHYYSSARKAAKKKAQSTTPLMGNPREHAFVPGVDGRPDAHMVDFGGGRGDKKKLSTTQKVVAALGLGALGTTAVAVPVGVAASRRKKED